MKIAAFTMVHNEPLMLPLWAAHYGRELGAAHLYCIDHGSDGGLARQIVPNTIVVPRGEFDEYRRAESVSSFHRALLGHYDAVIFTDVDEFLVADPALYDGLADLVAQTPAESLGALGFDVLQVRGVDAPFDATRPVLEQRRFAKLAPRYCKTLISRVPIAWGPGFHHSDRQAVFPPGLFMFHMKCLDEDAFRATHRHRMGIAWSDASRAAGHGRHWRLDLDTIVRRSFLTTDPAEAEDLPSPDRTADPAAWLHEASRRPGVFRIPERFRPAIPAVGAGDPEKPRPVRTLVAAEAPAPADAPAAPDTPRNVVEAKLDGMSVRFLIAEPRDHIQRHHAKGRFYEARQLLIHQDVVPRRGVVLDIGANVGNHTLFYACHTEASSIIPFEPQARARAVLLQNLELNARQVAKRVDTRFLHLALAGQRKRVEATASGPGNWGATQFLEADQDSADAIEAAALDDLPLSGGIGFIKLDVEGMEIEILQGAERTIAANRPVIFIEVNIANEPQFWAWVDSHRYVPVGGSFNYATVKNFLLFPRS